MHPHPLKKHIDELNYLSETEFDHVLSYFVKVNKKKHQYLVEEGETVSKEFWVIKGCLRSFTQDPSGKEYILQFAMENWWITDYEAYTMQTVAKTSIDCLEDCELLYITRENREKLTTEMHQMERFWAKKGKLGYIALQNRILSLLTHSAKERYDLLFQQYPHLFDRVPKKLIAAYLGVSRETLSRLGE